MTIFELDSSKMDRDNGYRTLLIKRMDENEWDEDFFQFTFTVDDILDLVATILDDDIIYDALVENNIIVDGRDKREGDD